MSLSSDRLSLARINKDIADLRSKEAAEAKKVAEAQKRIMAAQTSASKATSSSSRSSYTSTADRESRTMLTAQSNQARFADQVASKMKDAARLSESIGKEEERERKNAQAAEEKRRRDEDHQRRTNDARQKSLTAANSEANRALQQRVKELEAQVVAQLEAQATAAPKSRPSPPPGEQQVYDVFISHASEDKRKFVDEFAYKARQAGLKVWYDSFTLEHIPLTPVHILRL